MDKRKFYTWLLVLTCVFVACKDDNSNNFNASTTHLTSFILTNDSFPALKSHPFTIIEGTDTGRIFLQDSLPFGTRINAVKPSITCIPTASQIVFTYYASLPATSHDTIFREGDTLNWSDPLMFPILVTITSWDRTYTKTYIIEDIPIKKVDPDLFVWTKIVDEIYPVDYSEQQVLVHQDRLLLFKSDGLGVAGFQSQDGLQWQTMAISGLPNNTQVRNIIGTSDSLFYFDKGVMYRSSDGQTWQGQTLQGIYTLLSPLFYWFDTLLYVGEDTLTNSLALLAFCNDSIKPMGISLADDFPISNFASTIYENVSGRQRALVVGGMDRNGSSLAASWLFEHSIYHGLRMQKIDNASIQPTLLDASLVWYNSTLYMFGGLEDEMALRKNIYYSNNEGISWQVVDTLKNKLPEACENRRKQSVLLWHDNIYLIGGQTNRECFSDVYIGWLNKKKYNW